MQRQFCARACVRVRVRARICLSVPACLCLCPADGTRPTWPCPQHLPPFRQKVPWGPLAPDFPTEPDLLNKGPISRQDPPTFRSRRTGRGQSHLRDGSPGSRELPPLALGGRPPPPPVPSCPRPRRPHPSSFTRDKAEAPRGVSSAPSCCRALVAARPRVWDADVGPVAGDLHLPLSPTGAWLRGCRPAGVCWVS